MPDPTPKYDPRLWDALSLEEQQAVLAGFVGANPDVIERDRPEAGPESELSGWAELDDFEDDELRLAYRDRRTGERTHYVLAPADAELGLHVQRMMGGGARVVAGGTLTDAEKDELSDDDERDLYQRLLGGDKTHPRYDERTDVWARLWAEGQSWRLISHMGVTAMMWAAMGREYAEAYWAAGARPKAPEPTGPRQPTDHKGTGGTTRKAASGSSTTRKPRAARKKAAASPGRAS